MKRKQYHAETSNTARLRRHATWMLLACFFSAPYIGAIAHAGDDTVRIATWKIRNLSFESRTDAQLDGIAGIIAQWDIVALQEVRDRLVLDQLRSRLNGWRYIMSEPSDDAGQPVYTAFMWDGVLVQQQDTPRTLKAGDGTFERDIFVVNFTCGAFDFTAINTDCETSGQERADNSTNMRTIRNLVSEVQSKNGEEQDILLLGDIRIGDSNTLFSGWRSVIATDVSTVVGTKVNSDNIWSDPVYTSEFNGDAGVVAFDADWYPGDILTAIADISSHRPVWATFNTTPPDDDNEGYLYAIDVPRPETTTSGADHSARP